MCLEGNASIQLKLECLLIRMASLRVLPLLNLILRKKQTKLADLMAQPWEALIEGLESIQQEINLQEDEKSSSLKRDGCFLIN